MSYIKALVGFGEEVKGYTVPVLNEREIRAAAGLMFLALFISFCLVVFENNFLLLKYVIVLFFTDFIIRVCLNPRFAPTLIIGRLIVRRQQPEYVAAAPKKFAWIIGLFLSALIFILLVLLNLFSILITINCFLCLTFLFFETAFGICLGCWLYNLIYKRRPQYCAGNSCVEPGKQNVQVTSWLQILFLGGSAVCLLLAVILFNDYFTKSPRTFKELIKSDNKQSQVDYTFPTIYLQY